MDQLKLIIKVLGPPSDDDLSFINSSKARAYIRALPQQEVSWVVAAGVMALMEATKRLNKASNYADRAAASVYCTHCIPPLRSTGQHSFSMRQPCSYRALC